MSHSHKGLFMKIVNQTEMNQGYSIVTINKFSLTFVKEVSETLELLHHEQSYTACF